MDLTKKKTKILSKVWQKALGFMFSVPSENVYIFEFKKESRIDIHMMFVFYPLDVFYVDSKKRITEKLTLYPFTFAFPRKAKYIIEAKKGLLSGKVGEFVKF